MAAVQMPRNKGRSKVNFLSTTTGRPPQKQCRAQRATSDPALDPYLQYVPRAMNRSCWVSGAKELADVVVGGRCEGGGWKVFAMAAVPQKLAGRRRSRASALQ